MAVAQIHLGTWSQRLKPRNPSSCVVIEAGRQEVWQEGEQPAAPNHPPGGPQGRGLPRHGLKLKASVPRADTTFPPGSSGSGCEGSGSPKRSFLPKLTSVWGAMLL